MAGKGGGARGRVIVDCGLGDWFGRMGGSLENGRAENNLRSGGKSRAPVKVKVGELLEQSALYMDNLSVNRLTRHSGTGYNFAG